MFESFRRSSVQSAPFLEIERRPQTTTTTTKPKSTRTRGVRPSWTVKRCVCVCDTTISSQFNWRNPSALSLSVVGTTPWQDSQPEVIDFLHLFYSQKFSVSINQSCRTMPQSKQRSKNWRPRWHGHKRIRYVVVPSGCLTCCSIWSIQSVRDESMSNWIRYLTSL